jgi:hypothetical protein
LSQLQFIVKLFELEFIFQLLLQQQFIKLFEQLVFVQQLLLE